MRFWEAIKEMQENKKTCKTISAHEYKFKFEDGCFKEFDPYIAEWGKVADCDIFNLCDHDWVIVEEPKKKIKLYQYAYIPGPKMTQSLWYSNGCYYKDDNDFYSRFDAYDQRSLKIIKLENNFIEVDE